MAGKLATRLALFLCLMLAPQFKAAAAAAVPAAGAVAWMEWLEGTLDALERQLPEIAESAGAAAETYVRTGCAIRAEGDPAIRSEALGRSGGIMEMNSHGPASITLFFPRDAAALEAIAAWREAGPVVLFAPRWLLAGARPEATADALVTHQAPGGGLFPRPDGGRLVDLDGVAGTAALWVWTGEFVAACTRLGKMPCMYQGYAVAGGRERAERLRRSGTRFHAETPAPLAAGIIGKAYLDSLRRDLAAVYANEMESVRRLAAQALAAMQAGRGVHILPNSHVLVNGHIGGPFDPGYFTRLNRGWNTLRKDVKVRAGDLVFGNGFDEPFPGRELAERWRASGAVLAWSFAANKTEPGTGAMAPGEIFINQHWRHGDAVVEVPGYDISILPTSGVITETVLRLAEAEIVRLADGRPAVEIRPPRKTWQLLLPAAAALLAAAVAAIVRRRRTRGRHGENG